MLIDNLGHSCSISSVPVCQVILWSCFCKINRFIDVTSNAILSRLSFESTFYHLINTHVVLSACVGSCLRAWRKESWWQHIVCHVWLNSIVWVDAQFFCRHEVTNFNLISREQASASSESSHWISVKRWTCICKLISSSLNVSSLLMLRLHKTIWSYLWQ